MRNKRFSKKKNMFYLFYFTFIFPFVCLFVIQGFKVQRSFSNVGTCQPALLLNVMKTFCWSEPYVPNCMYIPLSMPCIYTVHKKNIKEIQFLDAALKKSENTKESSQRVRFLSQCHGC